MKTVTQKIVVVILLLCLVFTVAGCNSMDEREEAVRQLLAQFQQACNAVDHEAVLACLSPGVTDAMDITSSILGIFMDTDTEDLFTLFTDIISSDFVGGENFFTTMQIEVKSVDLSQENEATVFTSVSHKEGETLSYSNVVFSCTFSDGKWYITDFEFV